RALPRGRAPESRQRLCPQQLGHRARERLALRRGDRPLRGGAGGQADVRRGAAEPGADPSAPHEPARLPRSTARQAREPRAREGAMIRGAPTLATLLLLLSAAAAAPVAAQAPTIRWSMANEYPATSIQGEADARFAREVSGRSGGTIRGCCSSRRGLRPASGRRGR